MHVSFKGSCLFPGDVSYIQNHHEECDGAFYCSCVLGEHYKNAFDLLILPGKYQKYQGYDLFTKEYTIQLAVSKKISCSLMNFLKSI